MAAIEFESVSKSYPDGYAAVHGLDLHIRDGELMVLVGPSGCGKSTALRMVAGLEDVTAGSVRVGGREIGALGPKERDVAMVFQNYALYPHMTVRDNMGFALRLRNTDKAEIARRVDRAATLLDLNEHLDRKPAQLSGGQRQRVAMGRAIVREPDAFLMDEPLSNLDAKLRTEMRVAIARLQRKLGTTTIYVTHDQTEAMTLGDRVAVMRDGVLQQVDTPTVLYDYPGNVFVASFIGAPPMNLVPGEVVDDALCTPLGRLPLTDRMRSAIRRSGKGEKLIVGLRAEDLTDGGPATDEPSDVPAVDVVIELTEAAGRDVYAYFAVECDEQQLAELTEADSERPANKLAVARLDGTADVNVGDKRRLLVDLDKVHLFDARDGEALLARD